MKIEANDLQHGMPLKESCRDGKVRVLIFEIETLGDFVNPRPEIHDATIAIIEKERHVIFFSRL